ncbi:MAG: BRCT domain-containing protein, partial [Verrucomicrobiota bacterium]|nr:BRCT domain-containing protein [Verrucomicrobiota bacterium]
EKEARRKRQDELKAEIKESQAGIAEFEISPDIGAVASRNLLSFFKSEHGQRFMEHFRQLELNPHSDNFAPRPVEEAASGNNPLAGKSFVITGTLSMARSDYKTLIEQKGGKVTGAISRNTSYLLVGEGGGSKRDKATSLGVAVISEDELQSMLV